MYTECPKCQSVFMVSEQDISAHEGLVRCGNCYSVFNAGANLTDDPQGTEDAGLAAPQPDASATATGLPEGASAVSTASDFTFNFVEEETEETVEADAEEPAQPAPETSPEVEEIDPFPEPDFTGESLDKSAADTTTEAEKDNSLLYFGPDQTEDPQPEPEDIATDANPIDSALLTSGVFNPATSNEAHPSADEDSATEIDARSDPVVETDEAEDAVDEEPYAGPEISEQAEDSDSDFAMPDFSPLEGLEPDSTASAPVAAFSADDEQQDDVAEVGHIETNLDEASLWPDEDEMDHDDTASLPNPSVSPRFLADETHDALQAFDGGITDMGLETPGQASDDDLPSIESDEPEDVADDTSPLAGIAPEPDVPVAPEADPESEPESESAIEPKPEPDFDDFDRTSADETESVFITSEEDEADEAYPSMNVENDKAYHNSRDGDFPLPDEMEDFDQHDNPDIDKLLQQAADGQAEIDAKLAEAEVDDPEMGTPDIDDDSEDDPSLIPAPPHTDNGSIEPPGLMGKVSAGIGAVADKLHFGRRSYHGLDTYETQEHQDTLLVRQLEHESHGSMFDFISPGMQRTALVLINVALFALLLFQIGKYFMDDLAQVRVLRPVLVAGCQLAGCSVPMASNPAAIEQLSSKMTILDGEKGGLRIAVTLINRDNNEQPFPALELSLTDRSGRVISRQIVKADQYRGKSAAYALMQPGQAEDIKILLRTPAVRVDGFELRPVKLNWLDPR